jgi:hypothetical protein
VLHSVLDARVREFDVIVHADAVRAVNAKPGDGERALREMEQAGATLTPRTSAPVTAAGRSKGAGGGGSDAADPPGVPRGLPHRTVPAGLFTGRGRVARRG